MATSRVPVAAGIGGVVRIIVTVVVAVPPGGGVCGRIVAAVVRVRGVRIRVGSGGGGPVEGGADGRLVNSGGGDLARRDVLDLGLGGRVVGDVRGARAGRERVVVIPAVVRGARRVVRVVVVRRVPAVVGVVVVE